jgi:hypothetical protein
MLASYFADLGQFLKGQVRPRKWAVVGGHYWPLVGTAGPKNGRNFGGHDATATVTRCELPGQEATLCPAG